MPASFIAAVEAHRLPGQQSQHNRTHGNIARPDQKMKMIGHQSKGVAGGSGLHQNATRSVQNVIPMLSLKILLRSIPQANDMMQGSRCVYS